MPDASSIRRLIGYLVGYGTPPSFGGRWGPTAAFVASAHQADGVILAARPKKWRLGDPPSHFLWEIELRVQPPGGQEFEVTIKEWFPVQEGNVPPGTPVRVLYDPDDLKKTIVDHRTDAEREAGTGGAAPDLC